MLLILQLLACSLVQGDGVAVDEDRDAQGAVAVDNATFVDVLWSAAEDASASLRCDQNLLPYLETEVQDGTLRLRTPPNLILDPAVDCTLTVTTPCLQAVSQSGSGDFIAQTEACGLDAVHISGSGGVQLGVVSAGAFSWHGSGAGALTLEQLTADSVSLHGSGSGGADLGEVAVGAIDVDLSGSGGVTLSGLGDSLVLDQTGSGGLGGRELQVQDLDAHMTSSADAHVQATGAVTAHLTGSGSLHLYGEPESLDADTTGSGDVVVH